MSERHTARVRYLRVRGDAHNPSGAHSTSCGIPQWVEVFVPPVAADSGWVCGSRFVWQIGPATLLDAGVSGSHWYFCEHQIEVGD